MSREGSSSPAPVVDGSGLRVCLISARFNDRIVDALAEGARRGLERCGVSEVTEITVPGALEIPAACDAANTTLLQSLLLSSLFCWRTLATLARVGASSYFVPRGDALRYAHPSRPWHRANHRLLASSPPPPLPPRTPECPELPEFPE